MVTPRMNRISFPSWVSLLCGKSQSSLPRHLSVRCRNCVTRFGFQLHLFLAVYLWFSHLISVSQFPYLINGGNNNIYLSYFNKYV